MAMPVCESLVGTVPAEIVCFFYSYRDHRDLHSFPTRRSSDLCRLPGVVLLVQINAPAGHCGERARSEEHTSELQSRQYLVCRLMLEKKKSATSRIAARHLGSLIS